MNIIQRRMLADVATLDLLRHPPQLAVPVHFVFGEQDALTAAFMSASGLPRSAAGHDSAVASPDAGHMVHFDRPDVVRSIAEQA